MKQRRFAMVLAVGLLLLGTGGPAAAQDDAQAMPALKRATEFLAKAQRFSVTVDIGFDVVQDSGQKIEFGETRKIVLRRPDRIRVDNVQRSGGKNGVLYDGKALTVFNTKDKVYARVEKPGTADDIIGFLLNDLEMRLPLAEMLDSRIATVLPSMLREGDYVERSEVDGVVCDHVAFRGDEADVQLWIAQGAQPLPRRVVITYRREDGRPQFWAQFRDWNLAPETPDSLFTFTPPADATSITVIPRAAFGRRP
jgi:hypothetical protein